MGVPADPEMVFCEEYARSGDALAAVIASGITELGDPPINYSRPVIAQRLLERPEIQAAIKACRQIAAMTEAVDVTHRSISADMDTVYKKALDKGDFKACISAKTLQANVLGLLEQKISITTRKSLDDMTDQELLAMLGDRGRVIDVTPERTTEEADAGSDNPESAGTSSGTGEPARISPPRVE